MMKEIDEAIVSCRTGYDHLLSCHPSRHIAVANHRAAARVVVLFPFVLIPVRYLQR